MLGLEHRLCAPILLPLPGVEEAVGLSPPPGEPPGSGWAPVPPSLNSPGLFLLRTPRHVLGPPLPLTVNCSLRAGLWLPLSVGLVPRRWSVEGPVQHRLEVQERKDRAPVPSEFTG